MKLIIDIPEHIYELAKENKLNYWGVNGLADNIIFKALANGTPLLAEVEGYEQAIEDIKTEINNLHDDPLINNASASATVDTCLGIIDKHLADMRGDT